MGREILSIAAWTDFWREPVLSLGQSVGGRVGESAVGCVRREFRQVYPYRSVEQTRGEWESGHANLIRQATAAWHLNAVCCASEH